MASFQAKTKWDRLKIKEKKIISSISSQPIQNIEFQKNLPRKYKKLKNINIASCQAKT